MKRASKAGSRRIIAGFGTGTGSPPVVVAHRGNRKNRVWSSGDAAMNRRAILDRLNAEAHALREKYRVKSLGVFGSMARGDDREGSDVDILVTFDGKADFDRFMGLKLDLEDLFGRRVDLVAPDCLRPAMRAELEKDLIAVS